MNLRNKRINSLVTVIFLTMMVHGYLSIEQDRENIERELTVGMRGFSRVLQAGLRHTITEKLDLKEMHRFLDAAAPRGNIHGVIVYNLSGEPVDHSASIRYGTDFPELHPNPIKKLYPRPDLLRCKSLNGYTGKEKYSLDYGIAATTD